MRGLYKYLVGGLVGAAFGFLVAPKRAQKVREALLGCESTPSLSAETPRSLPPAMFTPPAESPPAGAAATLELSEPSEPIAEPAPLLEATLVEAPGTMAEESPGVSGWETAAHDEAAALPPTYPSEEPVLEPEIEAVSQPMPWSAADQAITAVSVESEALLEEEIEVGPERAVEPEVAPPAEEVAPPAAEGTDLRARIEETRRRIQEEIDRPFHVAELVGEEPVPSPAAPPVVNEAPTAPSLSEPAPMAAAAPMAPEQSVAPTPTPAPSAEQGEFDYEAMRRRIEETRSRLKAKAFDAMMNGETSLLAQAEGTNGGQTGPAPVSLDEDVDQTIESGLSAEDT